MSLRGLLVTITLLLPLLGCSGAAPSAETVRLHIEREVPGAAFRRDSHIRFGRFTFGLVKGVLRMTAFEDRETRRVLSHVKKIDIASYEVLSLPELDDLRLPRRFERNLAKLGWYPMLRERDQDSRTWIFYRQGDGDTITNLYIVSLDAAELTVIDLAGRLDRLTAELVADDPDGFVASLGP